MNLSLNRSDDADTPWLDDKIVESIRDVSQSIGPAGQTVNLIVVDDPYIQKINREFRNVDSATDVISFSYLGDDGPAVEDDLAGEVYLSRETIEREAKDLGVDPGSVFLRASVHGLLHVVGHDHEGEEDASRMENAEKRILRRYLDAAAFDALL